MSRFLASFGPTALVGAGSEKPCDIACFLDTHDNVALVGEEVVVVSAIPAAPTARETFLAREIDLLGVDGGDKVWRGKEIIEWALGPHDAAVVEERDVGAAAGKLFPLPQHRRRTAFARTPGL